MVKSTHKLATTASDTCTSQTACLSQSTHLVITETQEETLKMTADHYKDSGKATSQQKADLQTTV